MRLGLRILSITAAVVIVIKGLQEIGFSLATVVAGASVTGLAVALAAQDTLKNIFNELNADSLSIIVIFWYHPAEYWNYLEHATWVNMQIMERFNAEGIDFVFPTQTLHLKTEVLHDDDAGEDSTNLRF